jgi:precorrin-3B methylase
MTTSDQITLAFMAASTVGLVLAVYLPGHRERAKEFNRLYRYFSSTNPRQIGWDEMVKSIPKRAQHGEISSHQAATLMKLAKAQRPTNY